MEAKAIARYMRVSAQKARLVANNVKGMPVEQALNQLKFTPKKAAKIISDVLTSAVANASQQGSDVDNLIVKNVLVDPGPTWKRIMPRCMGRAFRILKRTSHVTVIVDEK